MPSKKVVKTQKEKEYDKMLEEKAHYKLRTTETGEIDRKD